MAKELRPSPELDSCDVCARTILKGERAEPYLAPGGQRRLVCELCVVRAESAGWIRESAHADLPASRLRPEPRGSLKERAERWLRGDSTRTNGRSGDEEPEDLEETFAGPAPAPEEGEAVADADADADGAPPEERGLAGSELEDPRPARRLALPRRRSGAVRAVPTNAQVKVERALEVFNASQHRRTVAGLARTLGPPWVSAAPELESPSEVTIVVAWELSWYRYSVDLGDAVDPVSLTEKGEELGELDPAERDWNGGVDPGGALVAAVGVTER